MFNVHKLTLIVSTRTLQVIDGSLCTLPTIVGLQTKGWDICIIYKHLLSNYHANFTFKNADASVLLNGASIYFQNLTQSTQNVDARGRRRWIVLITKQFVAYHH
jgi:hypothetical protein